MANLVGQNADGWLIYSRDDGSTFAAPPGIFGTGEMSPVAPPIIGDPLAPAGGAQPPVPAAPPAPALPPAMVGAPPPPAAGLGDPLAAGPSPAAPDDGLVDPFQGQPRSASSAPPPVSPDVRGRGKPSMGFGDPGFVDQYAEDQAANADAQERAIVAGSEAQARGIETRGQGRIDLGRQMFVDSLQESQRQETENAIVEKAAKDTDAAIADVMSAKIDPTRLSKTMSGGAKMGGLISVALSGFLAPLNGGKNPALEMYERMIERDIHAQEVELANRRAGVGMKMNALEMMGARFKDQRAARAMLKAQYYDAFASQTEGAAMQSDADVVRANGASTAIAAKEKAAQYQLQARQWEAEYRTSVMTKAHDMKMAEGHLGVARKNAETNRLEQKARAKAAMAEGGEPQDVVQGLNGEPIAVVTGTPRVRAERAMFGEKVVRNISATKALYAEGKELFKDGWALEGTEKRAAQKRFAVQWVNATKTANGDFSAPNTADFEQRGVYDAWGPSYPMAELEKDYSMVKAQQAGALRTLGVRDEKLMEMGVAKSDVSFKGGATHKDVKPTKDITPSKPVPVNPMPAPRERGVMEPDDDPYGEPDGGWIR
jgi:hypothetical protein